MPTTRFAALISKSFTKKGPPSPSLLTGLIDYNAFASSAFLADSTGNGNTLTNTGGTAQANDTITGVTVGTAVFVAANSQTLSLANLSTAPGSSGSIATWIKLNGNQTDFAFAASLGNDGSDLVTYFRNSGSTNTILSGAVSSTPGSILTPGTWYNVIVTWDPIGFVKLYVNGTLIGANTDSPTFVGPSFPFWLGSKFGSGNEYNGSIGPTGIWATRVLTPTEIAILAGGGAGAFYPFGGSPPITAGLTANDGSTLLTANNGSTILLPG